MAVKGFELYFGSNNDKVLITDPNLKSISTSVSMFLFLPYNHVQWPKTKARENMKLKRLKLVFEGTIKVAGQMYCYANCYIKSVTFTNYQEFVVVIKAVISLPSVCPSLSSFCHSK